MRPDAGTVPRFTGYRERMKPDLLRILLLATLLSSAACRSARLQSVEDGRDTWRTDRLDIDRDGGLITVDVTGIACSLMLGVFLVVKFPASLPLRWHCRRWGGNHSAN